VPRLIPFSGAGRHRSGPGSPESRHRWAAWQGWFAAVAALLLALALPSDARAHAALLRSDPADNAILAAAPGEVRLWFNEVISAEFSSVQVFDLHGQAVELDGLRRDGADPTMLVLSLPELDAGVYSVHWRVLSEADGHFTQGLMVFGVGEGADVGAAAPTGGESSLPLAEVLLRWLNFGLLAALIGGLAARYLVLAGVREPAGHAVALAGVGRRTELWTLVAGVAAVGVGLGLLVYQASALRGSLPDGVPFLDVMGQLLGRSRWGTLWAVRQALLLAFSSLVLLIYREGQAQEGHGLLSGAQRPRGGSGEKVLVAVAVVLALSLVVVQALNGHAAAVSSSAAQAVAIDALHLLGVGLWLGTLLALAGALLPLLRQEGDAFVPLIRATLRPFGRLAAPSVGLVAATGLYSLGRQVTSADALLLTAYGRTLMGKVGLMLVVGAFGLLNSMLLHPRLAAPLARLLRRPEGWTPFSLRRLPLLVAAEVTLGLLLFLAAGLLTASAPARGPEFSVVAADLPESVARTADDLLVTFLVKPNKPGQNVMTVRAISARRPEPAEVMRVILRFTYLGQEMGTVSADADRVEPALYRLGGSYFSLPGPWQVEVIVRRRGIEDSVARFDWTVAPAGAAGEVLVSRRPWQAGLTGLAVVLAVVVVSATVGAWWVRRRRHPARSAARREAYRADMRP
jgi:copper transport protein